MEYKCVKSFLNCFLFKVTRLIFFPYFGCFGRHFFGTKLPKNLAIFMPNFDLLEFLNFDLGLDTFLYFETFDDLLRHENCFEILSVLYQFP